MSESYVHSSSNTHQLHFSALGNGGFEVCAAMSGGYAGEISLRLLEHWNRHEVRVVLTVPGKYSFNSSVLHSDLESI